MSASEFNAITELFRTLKGWRDDYEARGIAEETKPQMESQYH
jgi:hypothetical protein